MEAAPRIITRVANTPNTKFSRTPDVYKRQAAELAGKAAVFKIKLHEVKYKELPALDDGGGRTLWQELLKHPASDTVGNWQYDKGVCFSMANYLEMNREELTAEQAKPGQTLCFPLETAAWRVSDPYGWRKDPFTGKKAFHRGVDLALSLIHISAGYRSASG